MTMNSVVVSCRPRWSAKAAKPAYRLPEAGERLKSGQKLSDAYLKTNLPVVQRRLCQGGVCLALLLDAAFKEPR
jgi:hypothetical protein